MNNRQVNILICILVLSIAIISGSACSMGKINAQNPDNRTEAMRRENSESSTPAYKPPKRVSKDIIKTEEKPETAVTKQKKKTVK